MTLFVPSWAIHCAADSIVQITHHTEIAYVAGMAKNYKKKTVSLVNIW